MDKSQSYRIVNERVRDNAIAAVLLLPTEKKDPSDSFWVVRIEPENKSRTHRQNRYLWGVVYKTIVDNDPGFFSNELILASLKHNGLSVKDVVHEYCKSHFIGSVQFNDIAITASTKSLSRQDFSEYVQNIQRWAASELQIHIPDPTSAGFDDLAWR